MGGSRWPLGLAWLPGCLKKVSNNRPNTRQINLEAVFEVPPHVLRSYKNLQLNTGGTTASSCQTCRRRRPRGCSGLIPLSRCQFHRFAFRQPGGVEVTRRPPRPAVRPHQSRLCHLILSGRAAVRPPVWTESPAKRVVAPDAADRLISHEAE